MENGLLAALGLKPVKPAGASAARPDASAEAAAKGEARAGEGADKGDSAPYLVSITIKPGDMTIDGEQTFPLTAMGVDSTGDSLDVTTAVEWSSSDLSVVTVDALGVAHPRPVSGSAAITASDPESGVASPAITLTVERKERLGPKLAPALQAIDVLPPHATIQVADVLFLSAVGRYADGARRNVTQAVEWVSSADKVLAFAAVTAAGGAYGFTPGSAVVTARGSGTDAKVVSAPVAVTVVARPPPPVPRKWLAQVEISWTPKDKLEEWRAGDVHAFVATGLYSDGSKEVLTKSVQWQSQDPTVVSIDAGGSSKVLGAGRVSIVANWEGLATTASPRHAYFWVTAYGRPPKESPKPPSPGPLAQKTALAFVKNLVDLSQYRYDGKPGGPFTVTPTGEGRLDALLRMVSDVVRLWGETATILEARQIWKAVLPKLLALIKEAQAAKVGLEDKDLNPARDAVNAMNAWVSNEPGYRGIEGNYRKMVTPFGELWIWLVQSHGDNVVAMLKDYEESRSLRTKLISLVRDLNDRNKALQKIAKSAGGIEKEIRAHSSPKAEEAAHHLRSAERDVKIVATLFKHFGERASNLKVQVEIAQLGVDAEDASQQAAEAREDAEKVASVIDACFSTMKMGTNMIAHGPLGLVELFDVAKDLRKLFVQSKMEERLARLEARAAALHREHAERALTQARAEVQQAMEALADITEHQADFGDDLEVERAETEAAYDARSGLFKFANVEVALKVADSARDVAAQTAELSSRSGSLADLFGRQVDFAHRPRFEGENKSVLSAIASDAAKRLQSANEDSQRIEAARDGLRMMRVTAHDALYKSGDPRKKKPAAK